MGLLRTIFIIAIIYYLFKLIGRYIVPYFLAKTINRMTATQQQSDYINQQKRQEGKVTIKQPQPHKKKTSTDLGEYVDFEEIN